MKRKKNAFNKKVGAPFAPPRLWGAIAGGQRSEVRGQRRSSQTDGRFQSSEVRGQKEINLCTQEPWSRSEFRCQRSEVRICEVGRNTEGNRERNAKLD